MERRNVVTVGLPTLHTFIWQYLRILLYKTVQAQSSCMGSVDGQQSSSHATDFQLDLRWDSDWATQGHLSFCSLATPVWLWLCASGRCHAERLTSVTILAFLQRKAGFPLGFLYFALSIFPFATQMIIVCRLCGFTVWDIIRSNAPHNSQEVWLMFKRWMWSSLVRYLSVCRPDEGK